MSRRLGLEPFRAGHPHELRQAPRLAARDGDAERREAVVAPPRIVAGRAAPGDLGDEALLHQARDRAVERAGAQAQLAAGALLHVLDDRVAVALLLEQREEDVKGRGGQRQELLDELLFFHALTIASMAIVVKAIVASGDYRVAAITSRTRPVSPSSALSPQDPPRARGATGAPPAPPPYGCSATLCWQAACTAGANLEHESRQAGCGIEPPRAWARARSMRRAARDRGNPPPRPGLPARPQPRRPLRRARPVRGALWPSRPRRPVPVRAAAPPP